MCSSQVREAHKADDSSNTGKKKSCINFEAERGECKIPHMRDHAVFPHLSMLYRPQHYWWFFIYHIGALLIGPPYSALIPSLLLECLILAQWKGGEDELHLIRVIGAVHSERKHLLHHDKRCLPIRLNYFYTELSAQTIRPHCVKA